jgi:hypothetical protein
MNHSFRIWGIAAIAALLLCIGCNKKPLPPKATIQQYEVTYDARNATVSAMARFSHIDSGSAYMKGNEVITANGMPSFDSRNTSSTFYWEFTGMVGVEFLYVKSTDAFKNSTSRSEMGDLGYGAKATYSRNDTIKGTWGNSVLSANESIIFTLNAEIPPTSSQSAPEITGTTSGNEFMFDPAATRNLAPGNYLITITKSSRKELDKADAAAGGSIITRLVADQLISIY